MTFLVNLMFRRLEKFDGPKLGAHIRGEGAYIWDVHWVTYLVDVYSWDVYTGGVLTGFYGILK